MKKEITYKQKNGWLLLGILMCSFLVYWIAISETVKVVKENNALANQFSSMQSAPETLAKYKAQLSAIDQRIGINKTNSTREGQEIALEFISSYCIENNLTIQSTEAAVKEDMNGFILETNVFSVSGSYHDLVQLLYSIERISKISKVVSVSFIKQKDIVSGKVLLSATIHLQNVRISS